MCEEQINFGFVYDVTKLKLKEIKFLPVLFMVLLKRNKNGISSNLNTSDFITTGLSSSNDT
jgi:hypothetical protein